MTNQENFKNLTGFPYPQINEKNYVLNNTVSFSDIGLKLNENQFNDLAIKIAKLIDDATEELYKGDIQNYIDLCYPLELTDIIKTLNSDLAYMRLSFVVDLATGDPKLIEVNSQTPSFNFELEEGTDVLLKILNKPMRSSQYIANLISCFKHQLNKLAQSVDKPLKDCRIGLMTCDSQEDIYQMNYFKRVLEPITKNIDVLTSTVLDFDKSSKPFNSSTGAKYDILFNWFPLELSYFEPYVDGSYFHNLLARAIENKQVAVFNGKSFITQNKYLLAYIEENNLTPKDLENYLAPSFYTEQEIKDARFNNFIAKPIWGRQGAGVFGTNEIDSGKVFNGNMSDDYYNSQMYVYQPFFTSYPIIYEDQTYKYTLEKFVYKTENGWQAGGHGLRISESNIVDNNSSWLILQ